MIDSFRFAMQPENNKNQKIVQVLYWKEVSNVILISEIESSKARDRETTTNDLARS